MADSMRKCVGCRRSFPKTQLIRVVKKSNGQLAVDLKQAMDGRGAYVCRSVSCVSKAQSRNLLAQAFHLNPKPDIYLALAESVHDSGSHDISRLLGFAVRARKAILGHMAVSQSIKQGQLCLVIVDGDHPGETQKQIEALAQRSHTDLLWYHHTSKSFDRVVGKANCRCAGITDKQFASELKKLIME